MSEADILAALSPNEPYLIASRSGRVLQTAPAFISLTGSDLTGRNLNDFIDDNAVTDLILHVNAENVHLFDCEICGCFCTCGAQLSGSGHMVLVFRLLEDRRDQTENLELIRYMSRRVNEGVSDLSLALSMLSRSTGEARTHAMGMLNRSMLNLIRVSRNAASKADYADGGIALVPRNADLIETLTSICNRAAAITAPYYDITVDCAEGPIESVHDVAAAQRAVLDLIHHALSHSPLSRPRLHIRIGRENDHVLLQLHGAGSYQNRYEPLLGPDGQPPYGENLELDIASMLLRSLHGNLISSYGKDGSWICRATLPIRPAAPDEHFSSMVIDWYGGRDIVAVELSGILPSEAYTAGEEHR